jgi:hypothetical protein
LAKEREFKKPKTKMLERRSTPEQELARPLEWSAYLDKAPLASESFMKGVEKLLVKEREPAPL